MDQNIAKYIIFFGAAIVLIGVLFYFFGDYLKWIGNLPGDIKIQKENLSFYFPITTMILLSLLVNIGFRIFRNL